MPLIYGNRLPQRFIELAEEAERIDIAVAWARPCETIEALLASGANVRIAVGISKNFTDPSTLKHLVGFNNVRLRIVPDEPPGIFHTKYYCFHNERTICWVGSANLTGGGFGVNVELVHEFDLRREGDRKWFECFWEGLEPDPWPAIREYEENYTPPRRSRKPRVSDANWDDLPGLTDIETWHDFVEGLRAYNSYYGSHEYNFDVLEQTHSWLHTIMTGRDVVRLHGWENLTQRECCILRGFTAPEDEEGIWELLGTIGFQANFVLNNKRVPEVGPDRQKIRDLIAPILLAGDNIAEVAHTAVQAIRAVRRIEGERNGVGHAAATRWLALARPDCLVSVNGASAPGLGSASGRPRDSDGLADVYSDFLGWLYDRPWFHEFDRGQPDDPLERHIWHCRAALVDVFVYEP